jgi:hypothetical protein
LAGQVDVKPVLEFFVPRAIQYSDDQKTWRAGYGDRIYEYDQINHVVQMFMKDGKNTRRAVMSIWQPHKDTLRAVNEQGFADSKDYPCSNFLWFWIRNNKLYCKLGMRSNDWIFGGSNINVVEFSILQELILCLLKNGDKDFADVELGYYHHSVISLHLYDATIKQAHAILENEAVHHVKEYTNLPIVLGNLDYQKMFIFFRDIYYSLQHTILGDQEPGEIWTVEEVFKGHGVPTYNNQLYCYARLVEAYATTKLYGQTVGFDSIKDNLPRDLMNAVIHNTFTPKEWLEKI